MSIYSVRRNPLQKAYFTVATLPTQTTTIQFELTLLKMGCFMFYR